MKKSLLLLILTLISISSFAQGVTRSAVSGKITDDKDTPVLGAQVVIVDVNSGTLYGALTDEDGYYRISNVKPGGPYKFSAIYLGYTDYVIENIFIQLGQTKNIDGKLSEDVSQLDEVIITTSKSGVFNTKRTGAETSITQNDINKIPQASRSVADFVRLTPQAQISEGDDGFSISLGGQNNRFNSIYVDGAVSNDVFGLAGSGTNGGQTGVNPFSVDAIESFQVQIAPFDVRVSGFAGGAISAITRSGSNNWEGSVYSFIRNEDWAGKTPPDNANNQAREKLPKFTSLTSGLRLGGPIVKDKLFFFVNYERGENETPQPFNIANYTGDTNTLARISEFRERVFERYGYEVGSFEESRTLESNNFTLKLDANISKNHKLSLKYNLITADNLEARESDNRGIGFSNGSEFFESRTNTFATELNSNFGSKFANSLIANYSRVRDDRDPSGSPFPTVRIADGLDIGRFDQGLIFGAEPFSTANLLDQDIVTITDNFEIFLRKHNLTIGTHHEFAKVKNLFFAHNFGNYVFATTDDFINGQPIDDFQRGFSLVSPGIGDDSSGASEFKNSQHGLYVQDEFRAFDNLTLTGGIRFDIPVWESGPTNDDFNTLGVNELEAAGKNLRDARVGKKIKSQVHFSPRFGFNWDVFGNRTTQVRGGAGIFTSRAPLVWPGATYNNNGVTGGFTTERNFDPGQVFVPDVNNQPNQLVPGSGDIGGEINLIAPDTKLPQVTKYNIAVDQKIKALGGLIVSTDFIYSNTLNGLRFEQLNIVGQEGLSSRINNGTPDTRPFFNSSRVIDRYNDIFLLSNTHKGESWNASITIKKPLQNGFAGQVSYSYGDSRSLFDGTSSRFVSNWRNQVTLNGKNNALVGRSNFAQGHRVTANVSYELEWAKKFKTTISLFYEARQSPATSYIYGGNGLLGDNRNDNALIFVPASRDQINLVDLVDRDGNVTRTADQQYEDLEAFINGNDYLKSRRGDFAERNGDFGPWSHIVDLRILQDFNLNIGNKKHTFQFSADIFNFTNLLNKDWGKLKRFDNIRSSTISVVDNGQNPSFTFDRNRVDNSNLEELDDEGIQSSRWQMQLGLRYIFK